MGNLKEDAHALSGEGSGADSHMAGAQLPEIRPPLQDSQSQAAPVPPPLAGEFDMWSIYIERTLEEDKETVEAWNGDLDSLLLFAALFSAVLTTFVVESSQKLQQDDSVELLRAILLEIKATQINSNSSSRPVPAAFEVTGAAVRVNAYWFSSLVISLAAALITILAKQWVNYLLAGLSPLPVAGARHRQYRIDGMHKWKLPFVISVLPVFLHVSLLLFFAGLVDFVWDLNDTLGILIAFLVIVTSAIYLTANLVAYIYPDCPYKTSVAVFFGQALRLGMQLYRKLSMATLLAHEVLRVILSSPGQTFSGPQLAASREVKASEALRVLSLRHEEKIHVQRDASLIDAKILHWLLQKETRLPDTKQLGWKLVHFPDLLHHQQLLIDTRSYELLESLFSNCYVASYARLSAARQGELSTVLRTLATLESESGSVSETALVSFDTAGSRRGTSSRSTTAVVSTSPVHIRMSATSTKLVRRLLEELNTLPSLSLMAFTLRLAARMLLVSNRRRDWVLVSRGTLLLLRRILAHGVAYEQVPEEDREVDSEQDLADAVNTVLYVALHDTMFPQWKLMQSAGYSEQWFVVLPDMMVRVPLDPVSRRQIAWAICILSKEHRPLEAWNGYGPAGKHLLGPQLPSPPPSAATLILPLIRMLVPILGDTSDGPVHHDMLNAVVVAADQILRDIVAPVDKLQTQTLHGAIADACVVYGAFLGLLHTKLRDRILPAEILQEHAFPVERLQRVLFPVVRIATTLSVVYATNGGRVHTPLLMSVLSLLQTLITSTPPLPQWLGGTNTLDGSTLRQWAYRAACSIVKLYMISQDDTTEEGPYIAPTLASSPELAFPDVSSAGAAAFEFVAALELVTKHDFRPDYHHAERATLLATFFAITKDIFVKNVDVDPLDWDWNAIRITAHFVQQGGLSALVASAYPPVHTALFAPAIMALHTLFFAPTTGNGRRSFPPPTPNDRRHPVNKVASAIANSYMQFLRRLEETIWRGTFRDIGRRGLLEKITNVAGYLALFENPARWPNLDGVASMQSFFSAVLFARAVRASRHAEPGGHVRSPARVPQSTYGPEEIAAGLVRILAVTSGCKTFGYADEHAHCPECTPTKAGLESIDQSLSWSSANGWESRPALWAMTRFTLWTIHSIWSSGDRKSVRLRRGLLEHDLASRIRYFQLWRGEIGLVANSMAFRIGGTRIPLLLEQ